MYYEIVPMDRSHIPQVAALEKECFSSPWSEAMLEDSLFDPQASFIVAEDEEGNILGYAGLHVILDEGYIDNVAVERDARRHGVASALLDVFCRFGAAKLPSSPWRCAPPTPRPSPCTKSMASSGPVCAPNTMTSPGRTPLS